MNISQRVINYANWNEHSPLHFEVSRSFPMQVPPFNATMLVFDDSLEELVYSVLKVAESYGSVSPAGKKETDPGRCRSAFDVWRHIIFYKPEVTLCAVVRAIHTLSYSTLSTGEDDRGLVGQYCSTVCRRVFKIRAFHRGWVLWKVTGDEFGSDVGLEDWKTAYDEENK